MTKRRTEIWPPICFDPSEERPEHLRSAIIWGWKRERTRKKKTIRQGAVAGTFVLKHEGRPENTARLPTADHRIMRYKKRRKSCTSQYVYMEWWPWRKISFSVIVFGINIRNAGLLLKLHAVRCAPRRGSRWRPTSDDGQSSQKKKVHIFSSCNITSVIHTPLYVMNLELCIIPAQAITINRWHSSTHICIYVYICLYICI